MKLDFERSSALTVIFEILTNTFNVKRSNKFNKTSSADSIHCNSATQRRSIG